MGKRIELTTIYRPGGVSRPASGGSGATAAPKRSATPPAKQPQPTVTEAVTAGPINASSAKVGISAVVASERDLELARLRALMAEVDRKADANRIATRERVRKWRTAKVRAKK